MTPNADVRRGGRIERAAWMKQVAALYNVIQNACEASEVCADIANEIAEVVQNSLRDFGHARAKRTAKKPGGVGRR